MNNKDILRLRLINQQIASTTITTATGLVEHMIAMQAQEFAMAKWAIGLRLGNVTDAVVEKAFNHGEILRTHAMRPTWHFVAPADIRWLQQLTGPRVHAGNAYVTRQQKLDSKLVKRSTDTIVKALEGNRFLTRVELQEALKQKKIMADGIRLAYLVMSAELDAIICSGPRKGKQFTYALLDERAPAVAKMNNKDALAQYARRYFTTRGPATAHDFAYWSGLTITDAKAGAAMVSGEFEKAMIDGREYLFRTPSSTDIKPVAATFLMPDYDEYGMSYKDRQALSTDKPIIPRFKLGTSMYSHWLVVDGQIAGSWKIDSIKGKTVVEANPFVKIPRTKEALIKRAVKKYYEFIGDKNK